MDKKQAEEDAVKKAKEATHAAGKNTGMSGRDLVRLAPCSVDLSLPSPLLLPPSIVKLIAFLDLSHSSPSTQNGSKRRKRKRRIGIWTSIENRRKRRMKLQRWNAFDNFRYRMALQSEPEFVLFRSVLHSTDSGPVTSAFGG